MKNLFQYSAKKHLTKFIFDIPDWMASGDVFNEEEKDENTSFENGKNKMGAQVREELEDLKNIINVNIDVDKVVDEVILGEGSTTEKFIQNGSVLTLRDEKNEEKVVFEKGKSLRIADGENDRFLEVNFETGEVDNKGFFMEKPVAKEVEKKEVKKVNKKVEKKEEKTVVQEKKKEAVTEVVAVNETLRGYENQISALEAQVSGADAGALALLRTEIGNIRGLVSMDTTNKKLSSAEQKNLLSRLTALSSSIEAREQEIIDIQKKNEAREALTAAKLIVDDIDLSTLDMSNTATFQSAIDNADQKVYIAVIKTKEFSELSSEAAKLETTFNKMKNQVELFKNGAKEQERLVTEYNKKNEEQLDQMDEEMNQEMEAFKAHLDTFDKTPEALTISEAVLEPVNPESYQEIQQGMLKHRVESMKMIEEVNFLQTCSGEFAQKVAKFEEEKSELSLKNTWNFGKACLTSLVGVPYDIFNWATDSPERWSDTTIMSGKDNPSTILQKEQEAFTTSFAEKQETLEAKKEKLDTYGTELTTNSETLRRDKPAEVKAAIRANILAQVPEGMDPEVEPWKEHIEKIISDIEGKAIEVVGPAVEQLEEKVKDSSNEASLSTDMSLSAAAESFEYIQSFNIVSPTTLDMIVGFATKNVAKGLNGIGDVLSKNFVTGFAGGVFRAAGGLVEGVGTMITDPNKVLSGLGTLVGINGGEAAGDAWGNLVSALAGGPAWKEAGKSWNNDNFWAFAAAVTAGLGEAAGNVASFVFTGGAVGAVRGAGITARVASMSAKVGSVGRTIAMKSALIAPKTTALIAKTGRTLARVGKPISRVGNFALAPLKFGLKPLKLLGKRGSSINKALSRILTPTKWIKLKPGSKAAIKAAEKALAKSVKFEKAMAKLRTQYTKAGKIEKIALKSQLRKLAIKKHAFIKEALRLDTPVAAGAAPTATWLGWNTPDKIALAMGGTALPFAGIATAMHTDRKKHKVIREKKERKLKPLGKGKKEESKDTTEEA